MKKCGSKIIDAIRSDLENRFKDVNKEDIMIFTAGTLQSEEEYNNWNELIRSEFPGFDINYYPLSLSIGAHIGPGSIAAGIEIKTR